MAPGRIHPGACLVPGHDICAGGVFRCHADTGWVWCGEGLARAFGMRDSGRRRIARRSDAGGATVFCVHEDRHVFGNAAGDLGELRRDDSRPSDPGYRVGGVSARISGI